jgi:hypothetical protein
MKSVCHSETKAVSSPASVITHKSEVIKFVLALAGAPAEYLLFPAINITLCLTV